MSIFKSVIDKLTAAVSKVNEHSAFVFAFSRLHDQRLEQEAERLGKPVEELRAQYLRSVALLKHEQRTLESIVNEAIGRKQNSELRAWTRQYIEQSAQPSRPPVRLKANTSALLCPFCEVNNRSSVNAVMCRSCYEDPTKNRYGRYTKH